MSVSLKIEFVSGKPTTNFFRAFFALVDSGVDFVLEGASGTIYSVVGTFNNAITLLPTAVCADDRVKGMTIQLPARDALA